MEAQAKDRRRRLVLLGLGAVRDMRVMTKHFERSLLAWSRGELTDSEMSNSLSRVMSESQNSVGDVVLFRDDFVTVLPDHSLQEIEDSLDRSLDGMGETKLMLGAMRRSARQARAADTLRRGAERVDTPQEDSQSTTD